MLILALACAEPTATETAEPAPTAGDEVTALLEGVFDSSEQAASDYQYYAVQMTLCPVEAPDLGERVLYVEQALVDTLDEPYRQRLYVVDDVDEDTAVSRVFEVTRERKFTGYCEHQDLPDYEATEKVGCEVYLTRADDGFVGGTEGTDCESDMYGATYATSEVTLSEVGITSWDRGFDDSGEQMWGATAGGYEFLRQ